MSSCQLPLFPSYKQDSAEEKKLTSSRDSDYGRLWGFTKGRAPSPVGSIIYASSSHLNLTWDGDTSPDTRLCTLWLWILLLQGLNPSFLLFLLIPYNVRDRADHNRDGGKWVFCKERSTPYMVTPPLKMEYTWRILTIPNLQNYERKRNALADSHLWEKCKEFYCLIFYSSRLEPPVAPNVAIWTETWIY